MSNTTYNLAPGATDAFKRATEAFECQYPQRVLVCLLGETPAVITETLSLLLKEGIRTAGQQHAFRPTELRMITTGDGANLLDASRSFQTWLTACLTAWGYTHDRPLIVNLHVIPTKVDAATSSGNKLDTNAKALFTWTDFNRPNAGADQAPGVAQQEAFGSSVTKIAEGLGDVRTDLETQHTADYLLAQLADLVSSSQSSVHASLAGGRKSMGALLMQVMSLVGREQDTISHVLTHHDLESSRQVTNNTRKEREKWLVSQPWLKPDDVNKLDGGKIFELSAIEYVRLFAGHKSPCLPKESYNELVQRINARLYGRIRYIESTGRFEVAGQDLGLYPGNHALLLWLICQQDAKLALTKASVLTNLLQTWRDALEATSAHTHDARSKTINLQADLYAAIKKKGTDLYKHLKPRFPNFIQFDYYDGMGIRLISPDLSRFDLDSIPTALKTKLAVAKKP